MDIKASTTDEELEQILQLIDREANFETNNYILVDNISIETKNTLNEMGFSISKWNVSFYKISWY